MISITTVSWENGRGSDYALMKRVGGIPHYWDGKTFVRSPGEIVTWPNNPTGREAAATERMKIVGMERVPAVEGSEFPGFVSAA